MMEFDGNLIQLIDRLKRHPEEARHLSALQMVLTMIEKWNAQEDPVESSDEVPTTAWVVRRKIEMILPADKAPELSEEELAPDNEPSDRRWLAPSVVALQQLQQRAGQYHARPVAQWPPRLCPVLGRSLESLPLAWPHLKIRKAPAATRVYREVDPLQTRIDRWYQWLLASPRMQFPSSELSRSEVVAMFIALMLLWSQGEVSVDQTAIFQPLEVSSHGVSQ